MTMPQSYEDISPDDIDEAISILKPKGSQPADDVPIAVITLFKSGFVQTMSHPTEAPFDNRQTRRWIAKGAELAATSVLGISDDDDLCNIVLAAPEVPQSLAEAQAVEIEPEVEAASTPEAAPNLRTHFEVYEAEDGWRWRLRAGNGEPIASGEAYQSKRALLHALDLIDALDDTRIENVDS